MAIVIGIVVLLLFAAQFATPLEHDEAKQRMDRIGKIGFVICMAVLACFIFLG